MFKKYIRNFKKNEAFLAKKMKKMKICNEKMTKICL